MQKCAGVLLYSLQSKAAQVGEEPDCIHNQRVRQNTAFYRDWVLPKFRTYLRHNGWVEPPISAFRDMPTEAVDPGDNHQPVVSSVAAGAPEGEQTSDNSGSGFSLSEQASRGQS